MAIFNLLIFKIIAILLNVIIGFIAGKWSNVQRESVASLLFYFIAPIVFFSVPATNKLTWNFFSIILTTAIISSLLCVFSYIFFKRYWSDNTRNILAMSAGTANTGYFMLPIATTLFDEYTLSVYMMAAVGVNLYESSLGFYICRNKVSTGDSSAKEIIKYVFKLPNINAFVMGCLFSLCGLTLPDFLSTFLSDMRTTYSILGMMMIGLGLSTLKTFELDCKFTLSAFVGKFIFFPLAMYLFVLLDRNFLCIYCFQQHNALKLLSLAPMAANTIIISNMMQFCPGKVASTVLLSCLFVLVYIPVIVSLTFDLSL